MDIKNKTKKEKIEKEKYIPSLREPFWEKWWEEKKLFSFNSNDPRPLFTIDTPPPTISGRLHLGHVFSYTQAEVIAAWRRMSGFNVRYPFGLDNNGLPTEKLIEKELGIDVRQVPLKDFIKSCQEVIEKYSFQYKNFFKRLGFRWDLGLEYSTISPNVQKISQEIFLKLLKRGIIYRESCPTLYCPECQTGIAQAELEDKKVKSILYYLIFKKANGQKLIIATTRPEFLPACVAIFVHPNDRRYKNIVGSEVETPLGVKVKVYTDEKVLKEIGTGAVMCCTYGDSRDVYWVKTYKLPEKIILNDKGKFNNKPEVPEKIRGKNIIEGRKILIAQLKRAGLIEKEKPIEHEVSVHERCGTPIEIISLPQWFFRILEMKPQLLEAADRINWYPHYMKKRYQEWIKGLKWDWCISRQRAFGIPIPVFYCKNCQKLVLPDPQELPIDPRIDRKKRICPYCHSENIVGEKAVLDTWFTSALTPEINNKHPLNHQLIGKLYPMSMRPHGHDIIRSWTTYSIAMGLLLHEEVLPWKDLMISGHILAKKGEKISKKTGGGPFDPLQIVENYSADALRYAVCGGSLGKDMYFAEGELRKGQRLITKIYNAGKFVLFNLLDFNPQKEISFDSLEAIDRWILFKVQDTALKMNKEFKKYEFGKAREIFENFFWKDFCDNYLEMIKGRVYGQEERLKRSAQFTLYHSYLSILKIAAPFLPHITEEIYHSYYEQTPQGMRLNSSCDEGFFFKNENIQSIHLTQWPTFSSRLFQIDDKTRLGAELAIRLLGEIRKAKTKLIKKRGKLFTKILIICNSKKQTLLKPFLKDIQNFSRVKQIKLTNKKPSLTSSSEVLLVFFK